LHIGLAYYPAAQLVAQLVARMYILVNDCGYLLFVATPSKVSHSGAAGTWSSDLNTPDNAFGCAGSYQSARYACHKVGEYPNKAAGAAYTQATVIEQVDNK
jgi:hypothetical protein